MRLLKILLIIVLVLVTLAYGATEVYERIHPRNEAPVISCESTTLELSVKDDLHQALLAGVTAMDAQEGDMTAAIRISGISKFIDDATVNVNYVVFDSDHNVGSLTRTVRFTDYESPRFSLSGPLSYKASEDILLVDRLHAIDCLDGDITDSIRTTPMEAGDTSELYFITVQAVNSMDDTSTLCLPVILRYDDLRRPEVVLTDYLVYLEQGSSFNSRSYISHVSTEAGLVGKTDVKVEGSVDTGKPGTYYIHYTYTYTDADTNVESTGRSVLTVVVE